MKIKNVLEQILGVTKIWGEGGGLYGGKVKVAGHLSVPWAPPASGGDPETRSLPPSLPSRYWWAPFRFNLLGCGHSATATMRETLVQVSQIRSIFIEPANHAESAQLHLSKTYLPTYLLLIYLLWSWPLSRSERDWLALFCGCIVATRRFAFGIWQPLFHSLFLYLHLNCIYFILISVRNQQQSLVIPFSWLGHQ